MSRKDLLCFIVFMSSYFLVSNGRKLSKNDDFSEINSLLAFKKSSIEDDPKGILNNWISSSSTPCSWFGVSCSSDGYVIELNLANEKLKGNLQMSDLMKLSSLSNVYLSGNSFHGNLSSKRNSCSFEILDLSANDFTESLVLDSLLMSCDKLTLLNLSRNEIPSGDFNFGPSLIQLDLSKNKLSDLNLLSKCKNLRFMNLSYNNFTGDFKNVEFGGCLNLTTLDLSFNSLSGDKFPFSLTNCQSLEILNLGHNVMHMELPGYMLRQLKKLKQLILAHNQFRGNIPVELGDICGSLEILDLSGNNLTGGLPEIFTRCSSLSSLNLGNNQLSGDFLIKVVSYLTNLRELYVPFNNITGPVPRALKNLSELRVVDLSSNLFTGNVPSWFCSEETPSRLEKLVLPNNNLVGSVPSELGFCKNLSTIDLSFNSLTGQIPLEIWALPNLFDMVMWANNLTGEIPEGICVNGGNLETLILNNNFITGKLPESIVNCTNLIWVSLSSNQLTGSIPSGVGDLVNLAILQLGNNHLTGRVPPELGKCPNLIWLDLNSNNLTGPIPDELSDQASLVRPGIVSGKQFAFVRNEGGMSCRGAGGLVEFEGIRASRLESFPMVHSCPLTRVYTGVTVYTFEANGSMIFLDLSYNRLSGNISRKLGLISFLQVLNLGHNELTGNIPSEFGGLNLVGVLDLSHNYLVGEIPGSLGGLSFLSDLDVSNNQLTGAIPSTGQLTTFPPERYKNNSGLCGVPLPPCGSRHGHRPLTLVHNEKKSTLTIGMIGGIIASLLCLIILFFALFKVKKSQRQTEEKYIESLPTSGSSSWKFSSMGEPLSINVVTFEKPLRKLTFAHLLEATNGFSADSLIGSGGFGDVYKAQLTDGSVVAIKKLIQVTGQGDREFMAEMETIGKIKHRNLVPLLGYCKIGEERLLVYEYMKHGSLEMVLGETSLDWTARKKIAIGSARGLAFLHHSCIPHIIHRDMKSSNVLLDEHFEARVSDFGMARLVNALDSHLSVSTLAGTPGYVPPEYYQSFRCTTKGDVYSYGVVLLELLSGKRPIDTAVFGDDNNLVGWAKQLYREKRSHEVLDPTLISDASGEAELYRYLNIAFRCLEDRPNHRPTMIQVMAMFKELQADSESDILDGISVKNSVIEESQE